MVVRDLTNPTNKTMRRFEALPEDFVGKTVELTHVFGREEVVWSITGKLEKDERFKRRDSYFVKLYDSSKEEIAVCHFDEESIAFSVAKSDVDKDFPAFFFYNMPSLNRGY